MAALASAVFLSCAAAGATVAFVVFTAAGAAVAFVIVAAVTAAAVIFSFETIAHDVFILRVSGVLKSFGAPAKDLFALTFSICGKNGKVRIYCVKCTLSA